MDIDRLINLTSTYCKYSQSLESPAVEIQPGYPEVNCAVEILKLYNPNYFSGVLRIVVGPNSNYGHVQSGPDKDPHVIYINATRIIQEAGAQEGKAAAIACAGVIAHERGHVSSFKEDEGFSGGETPADNEESKFNQWLQAGGMKRVESLSCYQVLK